MAEASRTERQVRGIRGELNKTTTAARRTGRALDAARRRTDAEADLEGAIEQSFGSSFIGAGSQGSRL